ncbi:FGGY-family carbohydrate kinase [Microlunatus spumicola]|uniref:FGGY-family carbohydrate kinase n=1 Tax=Microlunatus spumicola TaxID=81499 RepID=A0ABP6X809_9ACTN
MLTTAEGVVVATAVRDRPRSMSRPRPSWAEVDADAVWWADVVSISRELVAAAGEAPVAAVCVSGVGPCLVLCDEHDHPVRPAVLYGIDMRAEVEIEELTDELGREQILRRCGKTLSSQAVGPKLEWVAKHEPEVFARARRWFGSSSYVVRRLSGAYVQDHHTASQCDPLYDVHAFGWAQPWADRVVRHLELPRLVWPSEVVGTVTADAADATGLPVGTPVCAGTVDAWAESFSAGVRAPGDLMIMYGSTLFLVQALERPLADPVLWTTTGIDPGSWTLAAGMATAGLLTAWVRDLVGVPDFAALAREAAAVPAGSDGLLVLPYFAGERTPVFDPRARGVVAGLTLDHTRAHLARAVYEGVAYGVRQILELVAAGEAPARRVVAVGGGTQSRLWPQIVSDVTGQVQVVPAVTIGASHGSALMAAIGVGLVPPGTSWVAEGADVVPDPRNRETYDELYAAYLELYPAVKPVLGTLSRIQERSADRSTAARA